MTDRDFGKRYIILFPRLYDDPKAMEIAKGFFPQGSVIIRHKPLPKMKEGGE